MASLLFEPYLFESYLFEHSNKCVVVSEIKLPHLLNHRKSKRVPEKIYFCFIDYAKPLTVWITTNWKILQEVRIPDHLTCLLRNLYAGQKATVRTGHGTTDWFQIGKGVCQGYILPLYLFNLYAEFIMRNARLDEAQAGINIAGRNINNLRYADDTTLMAESEEELKSLLLKLKEEGVKGETVETVRDFIFLGSKITAEGDCSHESKRRLLLGRKAVTNLDSILKAETLLCQQRSI